MKKITIFTVCLLMGLMFINAGLNKLFQYIPMPADMPAGMVKMTEAMTSIGWLLPLVAIVEIIGGILFILPKTRLIGALVLLPITVGILMTHIYVAPSGLPVALILLIIQLIVMFQNRKKLLSLIS